MNQSDNFRQAAEYSRRHGGESFLVMQGGKVVFEDYRDAGGATRAHSLASGTKTFWGVLALAAVQDGLLTFDEPVAKTITEWRGDPRKSRITVRHLLTFTSGLESGKEILEGQPRTKDIFNLVLDIPSYDTPGDSFVYGPSHLTAFGLLLKRKLGSDPVEYLERRIFRPIGLTVGRWNRDKAGNPTMAAGAWITAREWAKFGELINKGGNWLGNQVVRPELFDIMLAGSRANPEYGMAIWLNNASERPAREGGARGGKGGRAGIPKDAVMAAGKGKQRLFVIRSLDTVIVRQGESGNRWSDQKFLRLLLGQTDRDARDTRQRRRRHRPE